METGDLSSQEMINSCDSGQIITGKQLYDLRAGLTSYWLYKDKKVILKDAAVKGDSPYNRCYHFAILGWETCLMNFKSVYLIFLTC